MYPSSSRSLTAVIALQLALVCHGFSPMPTASNTPSVSLSAHARRSHTYDSPTQDSKTVFGLMDRDGNGKIDAQEMRDYLKSIGPYTEEVAKSIFERLDVNSDGSLDQKELQQGMEEHDLFIDAPLAVGNPKKTFPIRPKKKSHNKRDGSKQQSQKKIQQYTKQAQQFFDALDVNRDGFISMIELKEHFLVKRMQVVAHSSGLLSSLKSSKRSKAPSQGDASVPWHYSEAAIQQLFEAIDVHNNGRISLQDLREAFVRHPSVRHAFQA